MILLKNSMTRIFILSVFFTFSINVTAQSDSIETPNQDQYEAGKKIFEGNNCNSCHTIGGGKTVGPDLKGVLDRRTEESIIKFVQDPTSEGVTLMPPQPLSADEIKSVLEYIKNYTPENGVAGSESDDSNEGMSPIIMLIIVIIALFGLIFLLTSIKNSLKKTQDQPTETVFESITNFCKAYWANKKAVLITAFILFILLLKIGFDFMMGIGNIEGYQPEQPIAFSHKIHAGDNGMDCNYCHSSARSSKMAGVPSANVCMNCHASIKGADPDAKEEIGKIWNAFGLDINEDEFDWDKLKAGQYPLTPIEWVRVHQLPDLTYFNHSQHVNVGDLECQQCHGDMQKKTVGQVAYHDDELNKIQQNIDEGIKFKHPTLTMGWCIDCHRQKEIDMEGNDYYTEMHDKIKNDSRYNNKKITPALIGGLECGKCHY